MILENGDILTVGNGKYIVLESARYEDVNYLFTNKLDNEEEITEEYYVLEKNENGVLFVSDKKVLEVILPVFSNKIQKIVDQYNLGSKFEI